MFANKKVIDLVPEDLRAEFIKNPPPPYALSDSEATLLEFYHQLQGLFEFRSCGAAHHFPWVKNQNPDCCPWMRTNPGCTHADTSVSAEFHWIEKIVNALNEHCNYLIVDPEDMKLIHDLFFSEYIMHTGSPRLNIYFRENRKTGASNPQEFSPELAAEVERVKAFQKEKSEFFFILCKFLSDRIQEVLLIPDQLQFLSASPSHLKFVDFREASFDRSNCDALIMPRDRSKIPFALSGTNIKALISRMRGPRFASPDWEIAESSED